jgi:phosphate transport system permease protein
MATRTSRLTSSDVVRKSITGRRIDLKDYLFQGALLATLLISLLTLVVLLATLVQKGAGVLTERGTGFVTSNLSTFSADTAGVWKGIVGSIGTLLFVIVFAIPVGVGAAIYLEEYASDTRFNRFINVNIRNLAGVPSIVYGLLGLAVFVELMQGVTGGRSMIAGGLTLAVLVLPIVIITSAEALRAVPDSIREAGYGVGATRWEVIRHHVLPSAAPGIFTGTILSLARALGETAPVLLVGAVTGFLATGGANLFEQMRQQFTTLPTVVFAYSGLPNAAFRDVAAAAILVLLGVILTANAAAILLRNRYERKW